MTYGIVINDVLQAAEQLAQQGISAEVVKLAQVAPLE
ncbi:MAG: transketolase C-terminal domain-containing protein [Oscillospiraceae bacterium]